MKVLLSIKPEYAEKILEGTKRFEFRKNIYRNKDAKTIVLYVTRPVGKIVGEFDVNGIVEGSLDYIWSETKDAAGITQEFFRKYFEGRDLAYAFVIGSVRQYEAPISPEDVIVNFTPPQSYMYVDDDLRRLPHPEALPGAQGTLALGAKQK